jgi:hypothetical protein
MITRTLGLPLLAFVLVLGQSASSARAESVLFLASDARASELFAALELALRGYGPVPLLHSAPEGEDEEARLASARGVGAEAGSSVVLWVEHAPPERVRAVATAQPERLLDAPLTEPHASIDARAFGSIAASLALQALRAQSLPAAARAAPTAAQPPPGKAALPPRPRRFFLRPSFAVGVALVRAGQTADRSPSVALVTQAQEYVEEGEAGSYLYDNGYDCEISTHLPLVASSCAVAVRKPGAVSSPVFDLAAGVRVWRELAVALTLRFNGQAGLGVLASTLLGTEASWSLLAPPRRGFFLDLQGGFGIGQIQARPGTESERKGPYVSSGLYNLRAGTLIGYRIVSRFGLFAGLTVHAMLPNTLWAFDPKVGVELRL